MPPIPRPAAFALAAAAVLFHATPAMVHPHVFAEARLDVVVGSQGNLQSLRHLWRFDDLFSSTVLVEFDANSDLQLDQAELDEVANVVHASLAEFDYFQLVTENGKPVEMEAPERLIANFEDNQLIILFESQPKKPMKIAGTVDFGVYDPTFYTAIDFIEDENMAVKGMPQGCTREVIRPDPDEAIAQNQTSLTEAFFNDPGGNDLSKLFATRLELKCSAEG
ncbi:DUF1007 family protein [Mesorhizobium xinjiangense]|uniref:DUF1007 family protein n=1 Tax=Mesorhizobium xinjiangense TaxID=2678685 RepID=UPI0012EE7F1D|nr:DUF1007 family protein [Mesorhizobium xinjiangense]